MAVKPVWEVHGTGFMAQVTVYCTAPASVGTGHGLLRGRSGRRSRAELEQAPEPELEQQRTAKGACGVSCTYLCLWVSETQTEYFLAF